MQKHDLLARIADRAQDLGDPRKKMHIMMDVDVANDDCPMDLAALLETDHGNFAHDVGGIRQHLDRSTGKLMDCFRPRFAI